MAPGAAVCRRERRRVMADMSEPTDDWRARLERECDYCETNGFARSMAMAADLRALFNENARLAKDCAEYTRLLPTLQAELQALHRYCDDLERDLSQRRRAENTDAVGGDP